MPLSSFVGLTQTSSLLPLVCFSADSKEVSTALVRGPLRSSSHVGGVGFGLVNSGHGFLEDLDPSMASVEGSPQISPWFLSVICVTPDQMPCLFILDPSVALIKSDKDQPVRMQVSNFWRSVESSSQGSKLMLKMLGVRVGKPPSICVLSGGKVCCCLAVKEPQNSPLSPTRLSVRKK